VLIQLAVVEAIAVLIVLWPRLKPRLLSTWDKLKEGAAILSDGRLYARGWRYRPLPRTAAGSA
jgi:hypothetical protein